MNIYFLVEGKRTERKVYPAWLSYILPELKQVQRGILFGRTLEKNSV